MDMGVKSLCRFAILLCCLCAVCPVWGIVLHTDNEPNLATWVDRPSTGVVGRWGTNASCVAIAPNYVITTRHQGISSGTTVEFECHPDKEGLIAKNVSLVRQKTTGQGPNGNRNKSNRPPFIGVMS